MDKLISEFKKKGIPIKELDELSDIAKGDSTLFRSIAERRLLKEPIAYIRGHTIFYGRKFNVDSRVYVPNVETENLVRESLDDLTAKSSVLDVGTGSGSIAVTVKKERPSLVVYGSDISPCALDVARANARKHNADVQFFESYYVDNLTIDEPTHIIADMPWGDERYVLGTNDMKEMKHMPFQAIFHPKGILESYRELIDSIQRKGWKPTLFFESGRVEEAHVKEIVPEGLNLEYVPFENYSVSIVRF